MVRIPPSWSTRSQLSPGKTRPTQGSSDEDLSLNILVQDLYNLLRIVFPDALAAPSLLVRAASSTLAGAAIVNVVPRLLEAKYRVSGVAVLDVVEGTALDALPHMPSILNSRPEGFDSVSDAIEWQYVISLPSLHLVGLR